MTKETTKNTLLEAGRRSFLQRGYNHSGIEAILQDAGVPKGSFYYYFESKEDFGLQVLDRFAFDYNERLDHDFHEEGLSPLRRFRQHFEVVCKQVQAHQCREGCLVGNLSQEMAAQSEVFRLRLEEIFAGWRDRYAAVLRQAQDAGELPDHVNVNELADFWLNCWQGAVLRAKAMRSPVPLKTFLRFMFEQVLQPKVVE